jgi:hypothetical protein
MLWSQFSAIFDNFRQKKSAFFSKTNVMAKILHNLALFWVKNAIFFRWIFQRKYFKNQNIGPRLAEFSPNGWLSTLDSFFWKLQKQPTFVGLLFPQKRVCTNFGQKSWATFWAIFNQLIWSPWQSASATATQTCDVKIWLKKISRFGATVTVHLYVCA